MVWQVRVSQVCHDAQGDRKGTERSHLTSDMQNNQVWVLVTHGNATNNQSKQA